MKLVRALERVPAVPRRRVVTLGNFDGVHRAHQAICKRVVVAANETGAEPAAVTFLPHPVAVVSPGRAPRLLIGIGDRIALLGKAGVQLVVVQRFDDVFAQIEAEAFVREYLKRCLGAVHVVVGHNIRFGCNRRGNETLLRQMGMSLGFTVEAIGPVVVDGRVVSSTAIREAIRSGNLELAHALLGREHFVSGHVVHGEHRGAGLGFPTANLHVPRGMLPPDGVYAVRAMVGEIQYGGVANLGSNPTFGPGRRSLEAHLFDFQGNLYGQRLRLSFAKRLRSEIRFSSPRALAEQIRRDVEAARSVLGQG